MDSVVACGTGVRGRATFTTLPNAGTPRIAEAPRGGPRTSALTVSAYSASSAGGLEWRDYPGIPSIPGARTITLSFGGAIRFTSRTFFPVSE